MSVPMLVTGGVKSVEVTGDGPNSAEIVTVIEVGGTNQAFRVGAYPATEPSVFSAFVTMLMAAYVSRFDVQVEYLQVPGETSRIIGISCT